jgi:hypothetical protein
MGKCIRPVAPERFTSSDEASAATVLCGLSIGIALLLSSDRVSGQL